MRRMLGISGPRPIVLVVLSSGMTGFATVLALLIGGTAIVAAVGLIAFMSVGILIEFRRPGQAIGRICLGLGWLVAVGMVCLVTATMLDARPGQLPTLGAVCAVVGGTCSSIVILASGPLLISRYPEGRDPGWLARTADGLLALIVGVVVLGAFTPGPLTTGQIESVDNPLGLAIIPPIIESVGASVMFPLYLVVLVLATVGLIGRYRRGSAVVRAQIRWFGASISLTVVLFVLVLATSGNEALNGIFYVAWLISLVLSPIAIGIAILRYRLYDIDRIVSNTIGYGLVTILLFGLFTVVNLTLVSHVSPLVNNEGVAVAGSTLLVAALFNPLRTRVQGIIDRRFHRARYDADRMASEFATRLRDQLDLATVALDLASTSALAVEPTTSRVWLRGDR